MSNTTFSGPIRSGTQRYGDVTTINTGTPELVQSVAVPFGAMTTSPTAQNLFTLPAGSKILGFQVDVVGAISGGSVTNVGMTLGKTGSANAFLTSVNTGTSSARLAQATVDAATVVANTDNIGTADVTVTGTFTAAGGNPTAGSTVVTVFYMQRNPDGTTTLNA